jgi:hypothetical protein
MAFYVLIIGGTTQARFAVVRAMAAEPGCASEPTLARPDFNPSRQNFSVKF